MNFNEKSKLLRYNFWMIVIIALLINLMAGIIIKIFEVLFPEKFKNFYVLIGTIQKSSDLVIFHDRKQNDLVTNEST